MFLYLATRTPGRSSGREPLAVTEDAEMELADLAAQNPEYAATVQQAINAPSSLSQQELAITALNLQGLGYDVLAALVTDRMVAVYGPVV